MADPFISVDDLSGYIGRDVSEDDGAVIAVDSACEMVRTLTEQDFTRETDTIRLDGSGTDTLLLPQLPVSTAGTVTVNDEAVTDYTVTERGHLIRTAGTADVYATWSDGCGPIAYWPQGRQNVEVTYTHGYTSTTIPADVRLVALMIANRLTVQGPNIQRQVGGDNQRYAVASSDLTNGELRVLRKYRESA